MQPCESRRNCQPETAETDFFHAFGSEEDGDRSGKTEVQGNERDLAIEAKHSNKRHTRIMVSTGVMVVMMAASAGEVNPTPTVKAIWLKMMPNREA